MRIFLTVLLFIFLLPACRTRRAVYNYLENITDTAFRSNVYTAEPIIQKNDILSVQIYSMSTDPKIDLLYNQQNTNIQNPQLMGYLVNQAGNIELPRVGAVHAEGLTKTALADTIRRRLLAELSSPTVLIRFTNFRVTVLGEVATPGLLTIPAEKLTILEAVGMAGGITEYGKIKEVKVLRENNGIRQLGVLDLTSRDIFTSPYYQLQQNDVVLVDQTPYRLRQAEQQRVIQQVSFATSLITAVVLIITLFK